MPNINWNGDATSAPFKSFFDETDGNLVIAEDTNGETRLLEWDGTAWQVRGPVELNGEDVSGVGTLSATDVFGNAVYPTIGDVPAEYEQEGNMVYTESDGLVVFES